MTMKPEARLQRDVIELAHRLNFMADGTRKRIYSRGSAIERALAHVLPEEGGCWSWIGATTTAGYAHMNVGNRTYRHAHAVLYEHYRGPIPEGFELDHRCRNRGCVNPFHLEAVTHRVNFLRGVHPSAIAVRNGVCKRGHPLTDRYIKRDGSKGYCFECRRLMLEAKGRR